MAVVAGIFWRQSKLIILFVKTAKNEKKGEKKQIKENRHCFHREGEREREGERNEEKYINTCPIEPDNR